MAYPGPLLSLWLRCSAIGVAVLARSPGSDPVRSLPSIGAGGIGPTPIKPTAIGSSGIKPHTPVRWGWRRSRAVGLGLMAGVMLSSCAGTGWGEAIGQALGTGDASGSVPGSPTASPDPSAGPVPGDSGSPNADSSNPDLSDSSTGERPNPTPPATPVPSPTSPTAPNTDPAGTPGQRRLSLEGTGESGSPDRDRQRVDLDTAPTPLQPMIADVVALGTLVLLPDDSPPANPPALSLANPVTRRQFVRWLVTTNNTLYKNRPAQQIRLATPSDAATFQDILTTDPDFAVIQGLANAGVIPSPLGGDVTELQFQPDAPLTRETLLRWKVPLDLRQGLPTATIDRIQQTWGFQDAARISAPALGVVLADFQNGDLSNIRRILGYTTLLQPQKPVTRAEAIAALWYFGFQGQGISAAEGLRIQQSLEALPGESLPGPSLPGQSSPEETRSENLPTEGPGASP
ncbi:MAG: hypothetical protein VKJ85_07410 [Prochlorothrix sp.]|nr:hypothetical protein [Prochlorothrix sp.]